MPRIQQRIQDSDQNPLLKALADNSGHCPDECEIESSSFDYFWTNMLQKTKAKQSRVLDFAVLTESSVLGLERR
jgi:hypothetical protein